MADLTGGQLDGALKSHLRLLGEMFLDKTSGDRLLALSEGFIKVRCAEAALSLGWTIQEGIGNKGFADFARLVDGTVGWRRGTRLISPPEGSADLAIVDPFEMLVEIKARPDHGTKSQAQFEQMDHDVGRVAKNPICALFFIFEEKAYRSFSLEKGDNRGRRALFSGWFNACFPRVASIPTTGWLSIDAKRGDIIIALSFRRARHPASDGTILVLGCQAPQQGSS